MTSAAPLNPFYARRQVRRVFQVQRRVIIGSAPLYHGDCFDVLPTLARLGAVITVPPYGIGFAYRTYDDAPKRYDALITRLVPELIRVTDNGPCLVWQSPLKAEYWHR